MKKRIIVTLLTVVMAGCWLTGCVVKTETIKSTKTETAAGSYAIFRTESVQEYFDFLENFDESKYEIIDISTSMYTGGYADEYYVVTYKTIE